MDFGAEWGFDATFLFLFFLLLAGSVFICLRGPGDPSRRTAAATGIGLGVALGVVAMEIVGFVWLYSIRVIWDKTHYINTSDDFEWPPFSTLPGWAVLFAALGLAIGLVAGLTASAATIVPPPVRRRFSKSQEP